MYLLLRKVLRIYLWPFVAFLTILDIGVLIAYIHLITFSDLPKFYELVFSLVVNFFATLSGVGLSLFIDRSLKREDDRRSLKFALSFVHAELRNNLHVLRQIKLNYEFEILFRGIAHPVHLINTVQNKYKMIRSQDSLFETGSFLAVQQSGSAPVIDEDEYFIKINQAYENLSLFRSAAMMIDQEISLKRYLFTQTFDPVNTTEAKYLIEQIKTQMKKLNAELDFVISVHYDAIKSLETKLNTLGVKVEMVPRSVESEILP